MNILEYYLERNKDVNWVEKFRSTSDKHAGKLFMFFNTNYRSLHAFEDTFCKFLEYNGVERSKWEVNPHHGQESAKQWVVRMRQSKLFRKFDNIYRLTAKGAAFNDMVEKDYDKIDKWLIIYIFVLTSYFKFEPNYLSKRVSQILAKLEASDYTISEIIETIPTILSDDKIDLPKLFRQDIFWLLSFNEDADFLEIYKTATAVEKRELFDYVSKEYRVGSYSDLISYKYKPSGAYAKSTILDDLKLIYLTFRLKSKKFTSANEFYDYLLDTYKDCSPNYNLTSVKYFIDDHTDIMETIFNEFIGKIEEDLDNEYVYTPRTTETKPIDFNEKLDDTTSSTKDEISRISSVLKRMAKERSDYKCELSDLYSCKYFTGKENNKNYLEIHHLVPREFSNEFEQTIEILSNYVALCPHCHRMLHFAVDRERIPALFYLLNKRKEELAKHGINIDIDFLKLLYNVEE